MGYVMMLFNWIQSLSLVTEPQCVLLDHGTSTGQISWNFGVPTGFRSFGPRKYCLYLPNRLVKSVVDTTYSTIGYADDIQVYMVIPAF